MGPTAHRMPRVDSTLPSISPMTFHSNRRMFALQRPCTIRTLVPMVRSVSIFSILNGHRHWPYAAFWFHCVRFCQIPILNMVLTKMLWVFTELTKSNSTRRHVTGHRSMPWRTPIRISTVFVHCDQLIVVIYIYIYSRTDRQRTWSLRLRNRSRSHNIHHPSEER